MRINTDNEEADKLEGENPEEVCDLFRQKLEKGGMT